MRNVRILAFLAVAFASTGCLRVTYTMNLKPSGAGTISSTMAMSHAFRQQAGAMMDAKGGGSMIPTEAKLREQAAAMGAGVRFVSATPYKTAGFEGVTALYAFDDVKKLKLNMEQAIAGAMNSPAGAAKMDPKADVKLTFTREGDRTVLVIGMPEVPEPSAEAKKQAAATTKQAETSPQVEAMMKQMIQGLLMEVAVNIDGRILKTNAPFVEGSRVVLLRMDGNEMLKSGQGAAQLMRLGQKPDFREALQNVPGLKVVTLPEVRIEFR